MAGSLRTRLDTVYNCCTIDLYAEFIDSNNRTLDINYVHCIYILWISLLSCIRIIKPIS